MGKIKNIVSLLVASGAGALVIATSMVKPLEGLENKPYRDVAGVLTVCFGHTGKDIVEDKVYSDHECELLLQQDLAKVKAQVDPLIKVDIQQATLAALYSFTYNVGIGAFSRSTLLKKLNSGDIPGACSELHRWIYAGGKKWNGLITRRQVEDEICNLQPP